MTHFPIFHGEVDLHVCNPLGEKSSTFVRVGGAEKSDGTISASLSMAFLAMSLLCLFLERYVLPLHFDDRTHVKIPLVTVVPDSLQKSGCHSCAFIAFIARRYFGCLETRFQ